MEYITQNHPQLNNFIRRSPLETPKDTEIEEPGPKETAPPIINIKRNKKKKDYDTIFSFECEEIARQMTLLDHERLAKINRKEMIKSRWLNSSNAITLEEYTSYSNKLSYWLAYQLVEDKKIKTRTKRLEHLIKIGMYLSKFNNYQSLMAIYLGINMVSSKLIKTWKIIKPKTMNTWKRLSVLMSPNDNFCHYRESLKNLETPYIPCQEVILKDLLYHDAAIPDFIQEGIWNFKKLQVIGKILDQFRRCQDVNYNFFPLKELQTILLEMPTISPSDLDSFAIEIDTPILNTFLPLNRILNGEKSGDTTESDTTDDSSGLGNIFTPTGGFYRSNSSRPRFGSSGDTEQKSGEGEPSLQRKSQAKLISITHSNDKEVLI